MTMTERGAQNHTHHPLTRARLEAMQVLERCVAEGTPDPMESFLQGYLVQEPPPLLLLLQIADDVDARRMHVHSDRLASVHTLDLLDQISDFLGDWISGVATRLAQRSAVQRGAVIAVPIPAERTH